MTEELLRRVRELDIRFQSRDNIVRVVCFGCGDAFIHIPYQGTWDWMAYDLIERIDKHVHIHEENKPNG